MSEGGSRHGVGKPVPLIRQVETAAPLRARVVDVEGEPVADAAVDALVCGWRTDAPVGEPAGGIDEVTAAYCQWGTDGTTGGDGVASLGPLDAWSLRDGHDETSTGLAVPPGVDPASSERVAAHTQPDTSGTQLLLVARYEGRDHDWFGAQRLPAAVALEAARSGDGPGIELAHKRLYGPKSLSKDIDPNVEGIRAPNYRYGAVTAWQTVPTDGGVHRLHVEVRSGLQSEFLGDPEQFPGIERERFPTVDAFDPETELHSQRHGFSGGLYSGTLGIDIEEHAAPGEERVLDFDPVEEAFGGAGRERVRSYHPLVQKFDDPGMYALTSAVSFALADRSRSLGDEVPMFPGMVDGFTEWRPPREAEQSGGGGPLQSLVLGLAGEGGGMIGGETDTAVRGVAAGRLNFATGVTAGEGIEKAVTRYNAVSAIDSLLEPAVDEPANDLVGPESPPFDPNRRDRLEASWSFGGDDQRVAAVLALPFTFRNGSEGRLRIRGGWNSLLRSRYLRRRSPAHDRVRSEMRTVDDRRVPRRDPGGSPRGDSS
jgi:hypothetical protein